MILETAVDIDRKKFMKPPVIEPEISNENQMHLRKGDLLWFSITDIHRDEQIQGYSTQKDLTIRAKAKSILILT